ncbi:MAG: efflux RND transporter periplasmic adaptor subunit [Parachlamydiales bacterium]|jgi:HlyD family secretion protein
MKRFLVFSFFLALILSVAAFILSYSNGKKSPAKELTLYGNVDVREVDIGFRVPGQVAELFYEEGDYVKTGALLAVLDKTPYNSQVYQALANVESIKANLRNAEILLKRREALIASGGVSKEELDDAQANRDILQANLWAAEAALVIAKDNLSYTEVSAPTDGVILTRIREPGTVVNPSDPVYTLSVSSPVWIRAFANEPELGLIYYGMEAKIMTDTKGGPVYQGKIGFISPVAEFTPKTVQTTQLRTDLVYRLRIYADNPDRYLKQGMPVTIKLPLKRPEKNHTRP